MCINLLLGPDQVVPSDSYTTSVPGDFVKLRIESRGPAAEPPISVPGLLSRTVARYPDASALATKKADGKWHKITYKLVFLILLSKITFVAENSLCHGRLYKIHGMIIKNTHIQATICGWLKELFHMEFESTTFSIKAQSWQLILYYVVCRTYLCPNTKLILI